MSDSEQTEILTESVSDSPLEEQINSTQNHPENKPSPNKNNPTFSLRTMVHFPDWPEIQKILSRMAELHYDSDQILTILAKFKNYSYSHRAGDKTLTKKAGNVSFQALQELYESQLPQIFGKVSAFILKRNDYKYNLLLKGKSQTHTYQKQSFLFLICSMALCLIPKQQYHTSENKQRFAYQCDFSYIFQHSNYKTRTVIEYLRQQLSHNVHKQQLTIHREVTELSVSSLIEKYSSLKMCAFRMAGDNESIQDYFGSLKVDFANRFIGGGALSSGCVQEEIMFANHPELLATPLLCEAMDDNEAIILIGFKKYACNSGYSYSTTYRGPELHHYKYDDKGRAKQYITAIDAISFPKNAKEQFLRKNIQREILKAYVGFKGEQSVKQIVTGNWGCGAFGGETRTKLIIQWIACTLAGKKMVYCPFGQRAKIHDKQFVQKMAEQTVKESYTALLDACRECLRECKFKRVEDINIFQKIKFNPLYFQQNWQNCTKQNKQQITNELQHAMKLQKQLLATQNNWKLKQQTAKSQLIDLISIDSSESIQQKPKQIQSDKPNKETTSN